MKKFSILILPWMVWAATYSQAPVARLAPAFRKLLAEPSLRHALAGMVVADAQTGKPVFEYNAQMGMVPGSVQKIFTAIAGFDLLGSSFRFETEAWIDRDSMDFRQGTAGLTLVGYGDPTLGSERFLGKNPESFFLFLQDRIQNKQIKIRSVTLDDSRYGPEGIPGGWIWEDIGNYYGAGAWAINWKENQFELPIIPGKKEGDPAVVKEYDAEYFGHLLISLLKTASPESGDNAWLFPSINRNPAILSGTVPRKDRFSIKGAIQNPYAILGKDLIGWMGKAGLVSIPGENRPMRADHLVALFPDEAKRANPNSVKLGTWYSPAFDSIQYFFLQKSINLYGEAILKAIAYQKGFRGNSEKGIEILKKFWEEKGIDGGSLNILDGSGLSPQNRVTPGSIVTALLYARNQPWFKSFYQGIPVYNGMKIKSGSINGVRALAGYQRSATGREYVFSILVNNFEGSGAATVQKMYRVLDQLK